MTATARQEREMKIKFEKVKSNPTASPLERLRAHVLSQGVCSLKRLNQTFRRMDTNKSGLIDFREFQTALHNEGIIVDEATERKCFDEMDTTKSGDVSYEEFLIALKPRMSLLRKDLVLKAFLKLDRDGSGAITAEDLKGVLNPKKHQKYASGEWNEDQVILEWLKSFDGSGRPFDGKITYEDFENYYAGVSASIELDCYFDLMMRQAWQI